MTDPGQVDLDLLAGLATELDPLMRGVLVSEDVRQAGDLLGEAMWHCMLSPLRYASHLYGIWAEIDDILDRWPLDYGPDTDVIALREFKRVAEEWLNMPQREAGIRDYVHQWKVRMAQDSWPAPGGVHWRQP
ncbi:hypothetical protein [Nonomuraea cavernae]|nr:hypothetical protein [Nonomuraea cavernae]MCA2189548.1 hypothetical protein [Nonomuraea cavernae]